MDDNVGSHSAPPSPSRMRAASEKMKKIVRSEGAMVAPMVVTAPWEYGYFDRVLNIMIMAGRGI